MYCENCHYGSKFYRSHEDKIQADTDKCPNCKSGNITLIKNPFTQDTSIHKKKIRASGESHGND